MNLHDYLYNVLFNKTDMDLLQYRNTFKGQWWVNPDCCTTQDTFNISLIWDGEYCASCDTMFVNTFGLWALLQPSLEKGLEDYEPKLEKWIKSFCSYRDKPVVMFLTSALDDESLKHGNVLPWATQSLSLSPEAPS